MGRLTCDELAGPLTSDELLKLEKFLTRLATVSAAAVFTLAIVRGFLPYAKCRELLLVQEDEKPQSVVALVEAPYGVFIEVATRPNLSSRALNQTLASITSLLREYNSGLRIYTDNVHIADQVVASFRVESYYLFVMYMLDFAEAQLDFTHEQLPEDYYVRELSENDYDSVRRLLSLWSRWHAEVSYYTLVYGYPLGLFFKDELVGYVSTYVRMPEYWFLASLFIHPDHRGRGLGTALMKEMLRRAKTETRRVVLTVEPSRVDARRIYRKLGFRPVARTQHALVVSQATGSS